MELLKQEWVRVSLVLIIGLGVIIYFNPPHTPCRAQVEIYTESITPLAKEFTKKYNSCKEYSDTGGCLAIFELIKKLENRLSTLGPTCAKEVADESKTKGWLMTSIELFVRVAWGSKPPQSYLYRNNWLELSQIDTYCKLRRHVENIYGEGFWQGFVERMLKDLPGAAELGRTEAWNRSLVSEQCKGM